MVRIASICEYIKTTEQYTSNECTEWFANCISIHLLQEIKKKKKEEHALWSQKDLEDLGGAVLYFEAV